MAAAEECNTGLCLWLGAGEFAPARHERPKDNNNKRSAARAFLDLSFTLCPKDEDTGRVDHNLSIGSGLKVRQDDGKVGVGISNSNRINISGRKKLRLTIEQSRLLEDSFKLHTTLNSSQKQALAEQLNLEPRQVEVWFQNRRARTKLKQNEVDCEVLKKCCESLTDENKRLKKELQELQSTKAGASSPLFIQLQKATTCPSCEKIIRTSNEGKNAAVNIDVVLKNNKWQRGFNGTN